MTVKTIKVDYLAPVSYTHLDVYKRQVPVRLAKIRLRVAWAMAQWHEHLPPPKHRLRHMPAHDRVATSKPLLIPQPLKNPMRRVPLLLVNLAVAFKNGVDPRQIRSKLLGGRPFTPTVSGRN